MDDPGLKLRRTIFTEKSTIGELYLPSGEFFCFTLEDVCRYHKVPDKTAIPSGKYEVIGGWSNRFQRIMPRLLKVPYFEGILIHSGNTPDNTSGCILVGHKHGTDAIYESHDAFEALFPLIRKMTEKGKLFIEITGGYPPDKWKVTPNVV